VSSITSSANEDGRRAAEQRDELAPFHCPVSPCFRAKRNSTQRTAALRDFEPVYDRCGS
jgi:hypothetical protein